MERTISQRLISLWLKVRGSRRLVSTAGTATTLAAIKLKLRSYSHEKVHGSTLNLKDIEKIIKKLKPLTVEDRKKIVGLEPERADIILAGALILELTMKQLGYNETTISDRGIRFGVICEVFDL